MLTLKKVNAELAARFGAVELVKGRGYFYFVGQRVDRQYRTSVAVYRLNELTLDQWVEEARKLIKA